MKMKDVKAIPWRIKLLITRVAEWQNEDGTVTPTRESRQMVWAMAGIHSRNWWWVRRYGKLSCGCTRNPLTRRMVFIRHKCEQHFLPTYRKHFGKEYPEDDGVVD